MFSEQPNPTDWDVPPKCVSLDYRQGLPSTAGIIPNDLSEKALFKRQVLELRKQYGWGKDKLVVLHTPIRMIFRLTREYRVVKYVSTAAREARSPCETERSVR